MICWSQELQRLFARLSQENRVVPLADLIDQPVMMPVAQEPA